MRMRKRMLNKGRWTAMVLLLMLPTLCMALKPKWVGNTPKELNSSYKFMEITSYGTDIHSARIDALHMLAQDKDLRNAVTISVDAEKITKATQKGGDFDMQEDITDEVEIRVKVRGEQYKVQAVKVDEYVERSRGEVRMHTLFMVALQDNPTFDRTYVTSSYGVTPALMSVIPGLGQLHKGSKVKAATLFALEAVAVAGIIVSDNERASYRTKMKEQPAFAKQYKNKSDNWETARNVCIGAAAGIWLYNIVDALAAKGARRVVVNKARTSFAMRPYLTTEETGISMALHF